MHTKIKPFNEWKSLDMSGVERRRLFCSILFHFAAALCVIWSLCVLIERAAEEVRKGQIGWPFWTKLVVVTVGLTGGVVFMYIQCKQYLNLCGRWRARNRILLIQNAPEKVPITESPAARRYPSNTNATDASSNSVSMYRTMDFYDGVGGHGQNQVIANIESEREWILDDVSQVSFKPCRQGSGSLTPFHDSIHNMYDQQTNKSACSGSTTSNKISIMTPPVEDPPLKIRCLDSAVFLENSDILGKKHSGDKSQYRHSSILLSPGISIEPNVVDRKNTRRYSDTKLLQANNMVYATTLTDYLLGPEINQDTIMTHKRSSPIPTRHTYTSSSSSKTPTNNSYVVENNLRKLYVQDTSRENSSEIATNQDHTGASTSRINQSPGSKYRQKSFENVLNEPKQSEDIFKSLPNLVDNKQTLMVGDDNVNHMSDVQKDKINQ